MNAEDLSFQSSIKSTAEFSTPYSTNLKHSHTSLLVESLPESQAARENQLTEATSFEIPTLTRTQSAKVETTNQRIYIPPSETSTTPPPPLTHSSSFESAVGFWKRQISIPATTDLVPSPQLSPFASHSDAGVPLPIPTPSKCKT